MKNSKKVIDLVLYVFGSLGFENSPDFLRETKRTERNI
jgi:hypothetical protein